MPILQAIDEYRLLLLSTPQALKFYMSPKCLQKLTWASRKPFPSDTLRTSFGQPSDNLRTLFGLFKMVSGTWEGRRSHESLGEHMGVGVGVWSLGLRFGSWSLALKLSPNLSFAYIFFKHLQSRKEWEALNEAGRHHK